MSENFPTPPPPDEDGIREIPSLVTGKPNPQASQDTKPLAKLFAPRPKEEKPPKQRKPTPAMPKAGYIAERVSELYMGLGMMMYPFDPICGQAWLDIAEKAGEQWEAYAKENPAVRRFILKILETSTLGAMIVLHLPVLMTMGTHHVPMLQSLAGKQFADDVEESLKTQGDEEAA